jgi:DNA (cytosine-5)-methyltransferase 1
MISYNMSRIRDRDTKIEILLRSELLRRGITTFVANDPDVEGKPDISFPARKIAVFCDSEFWHGHDWEHRRKDFKSNEQFWIPKIEKTMARDVAVTQALQDEGWRVLRFWGQDIKKHISDCVDRIEEVIRVAPVRPYRVIDLCAGIGGIRRGFERGMGAETVLSAEIDKYACQTYQHLFGENPENDLTSDEFKTLVNQTEYDILLAGFPCQTFSRVGLKEGFENEEKGQIFFHIAKILKATRPAGFFLENVDHIVTRDKGRTFKIIIETLEKELKYKVIGVTLDEDGEPTYIARDFVRNSRAFGVPQNRPRTYIIGFDRERFSPERLALLPSNLPQGRERQLYTDLNDLLERNVAPKYYMASGYFETLIRHRVRQEGKGYGFGYRIINEPDIEHPIANTILATGGSGRERNLIRDPRDGIAGLMINGKKTPLNDQGIRVMTPTEWGKLQGFINYGFLRDDGTDGFSFPDDMPDLHKYKQFGNAVTIPAVEEMARFMQECFDILAEAGARGGCI